MKRAFLKNSFIFVLGLALCTFNAPRISADEDSEGSRDIIDMVAGDVQSVTVNNLTRVSVTNPEVADIADAQSDKISVLAKKAGETVLFLWDASGKRDVKVRVVSEDLGAVKGRIQKLLDEANITGLNLEENRDIGKVVITGDLAKEDKDRLNDILDPYNDNLLNLVKIEKNEDLIEVDMQVVEISTTYEENLGIEWGNTASGAVASTGSTGASATTGVQLGYNENMPTKGDSFKDLFRIGNFQRTTPLQATINALVQEGKAKLISKPRLVVISGKQASFLVGGEIPIQNTTTSASGGVQQSNTTYTQYGVNMTVTPTIREGKIDVLLNVDIRDIDGSTPISNSGTGDNNVAFITRTASTDLLMDNKQTLALAGLIKYESSVSYTEVPFLSKIPILGLMFRNKNVPGDTNTEMVIILTPTVLTNKKFAQTQLVMPTPEVRDANKLNDMKYEHEPLVSDWPQPKVTSLPPEVPAQPAAPIDPANDLAAYAQSVQEGISKVISYPNAEQGVELTGTVKLKLHILKSGALESASVIESSGTTILDEDAIQAARKAAPYQAFSTGMKQEDLIFTIPIVYNKQTAQTQTPTHS